MAAPYSSHDPNKKIQTMPKHWRTSNADAFLDIRCLVLKRNRANLHA
jgi:hypothetical protein